MGIARFEGEMAPAGLRTGYRLSTRRRGRPNAPPTGLQLRPGGIFELILKNGAPKKGAEIEAPVSGLAFHNGAPRKSQRTAGAGGRANR